MINQNFLKYKSSSCEDDHLLNYSVLCKYIKLPLILAEVMSQNHHGLKQAAAHYLNPMTETASQF